MTLTRRWARVKAQLDARRAMPVEGCQDGVALWRAIYGTEPDDWQRDILLARPSRVLMNCARQSGKSSLAAVLGLYEALYHAPALVLLLSASLRQAQELGKKLFDGYRALGKPISAEAENRLSLELHSGSRIICLPSREATVRGFSGARLIVIDEGARVPDPLYHSLRPMLAVSGGSLVALSTPAGKLGWFFDAWQNGDEWQRVCITADQCPRITSEFLAEEARVLPSWIFRQEYFCEFSDTLLQLFSSDDVMASVSADVLPFDYEVYRQTEG
jgi:hypothetical protein